MSTHHQPPLPLAVNWRPNRRQLLGAGAALTAWWLLPGGNAWATTPPSTGKPLAKSVIQIWMWGGPAHLDTFDPKPDAGYDYCGPFNEPIATNVDGIRINQLLPLLAQQADKYAIIRSLTHGINGHETASYIVQTGRPPGGRVVYPSVGAVVNYFKGVGAGYQGMIPPYVVMTQLQGRFSEAGFLGRRFAPFATGGNPGAGRFAVEGIVAEGVTDEQQQRRRGLLTSLDTMSHTLGDGGVLESYHQSRDAAYELILGEAASVFDLSKESNELRDRYGRSTFGQACLVARRLVEIGVPYITINYSGWDTHKQHFQAMQRKLPELDKGMATLLDDLAQRGLLDQTLVWWGGEFGRTPKVLWDSPWNGGRNHFGKVFSAVLAGGGLRGGQVIGSSNATGEEVRDRPVYPCDIIAALCARLGIAADATLRHPQGELIPILPRQDESVPTGGALTELL